MKTLFPVFAFLAFLCFACEEVAVEEFTPPNESLLLVEDISQLNNSFLPNPYLIPPTNPTSIPNGTQQLGSYLVIEGPIGLFEGENSDLGSLGLEGTKPELPVINPDPPGTSSDSKKPPNQPPPGG